MQRVLLSFRPALRAVTPSSRRGPPTRWHSRRLLSTTAPLAGPISSRHAALGQPVDPMQDRLAAFTLDEAIATPQVRVKSGDSLGPPEPLHRLLGSIDRISMHVLQINKPSAAQPHAVVEVVSGDELRRRVREDEEESRRKERDKRDKKPKQIELNWAIGPNDLALKMKQMEQFLAKGKKVEILLAARRHQRKATEEEGVALLSQLREKIAECDAKEAVAMEGKLLGQATLVVKRRGQS